MGTLFAAIAAFAMLAARLAVWATKAFIAYAMAMKAVTVAVAPVNTASWFAK